MADLNVNSIGDASGGTTTTVNGFTPTVSNMAGRNRIINGDMRIDQRNAGASALLSGSQYFIDRWQFSIGGNLNNKFTVGRNLNSITPPSGFTNYLGLSTTTSITVTTNDYGQLRQPIEGFNVADLGFGTANAQSVTLSFWVRASVTGTYAGVLQNNAENRTYAFTFSVSAANTWEQKTITVPGDTSGTWVTDNTKGLTLIFNLGTGSAQTAPSTNSWLAGNYLTASGAVNLVANSGATFYITGVQLEKGSTATSFDYRPYGTELQLCQRYFEMSFQQGTAPANGASSSALLTEGGAVRIYASGSTANDGSYVPYKVTKRANPTVTAYGNSSGQWLLTGNTNAGLTIVGASTDAFSAYQTASGSILGFRGHYTSSAEL